MNLQLVYRYYLRVRIISKERTLSLSKNENMYKEKLNYTKKTKAKRPKQKKKEKKRFLWWESKSQTINM